MRAKAKQSAAQPRYSGWTNYETWLVALWLGNDESLKELAKEAAEDAVANHNVTCKPPIWTLEQAARFTLADALKDWVEDMSHAEDPRPGVAGTLWADLIGAALSEVDWEEIAS